MAAVRASHACSLVNQEQGYRAVKNGDPTGSMDLDPSIALPAGASRVAHTLDVEGSTNCDRDAVALPC
jgi:hypothetical protein